MSEVRVKVSQVVESQLPRFVKEEFPLVVEFLKQYYRSFEFQSGASDLLQNIDQYVKIDQLANLTESTTLTSNVSFVDETISVESTYGFPDSYGLIQIDNEIITYTSKTSTQFLGCIRGFSGVTSYEDPATTDQLVFSDSEIAEHTLESTVTNLSVLFLKEFFNKVKKQVSPGFESRELYSSLNQNLFTKQSKDFYSSKGTDASFKILFAALYGKNVEVIRPRDYLIQPSDAQYRITKDLVVEAIEGDPMNLQNKTLYQDFDGFFKKAEGTISKVEKIIRGEKEYYVLSLDYDYDKDINVSGTVLGEFAIHATTQTVTITAINSTTLDVDSTVGFPSSGELIIDLTNGTSLTVTYEEKSLNQFYGCSGITQEFSSGQEIRINAFAYGYGNNTATEIVKVRVSGVLSDLDILDKTSFYQKNDLVKIKCLGVNLTDYKSNNWLFNASTRYEVKTIELIDSSDYTYRVNLYDSHNFSIGDSVTLIRSDSQEFVSVITSEEISSTSESSIISLQNTTSFSINGQGELDPTKFYSIKKNILKVNALNYLSITNYTANIQNVYTDLNNSLYVASPSLPNYSNQAINIIDRSIVFSGTFSGTELNIGTHNFYTGDIIVYNPESDTNKLDLLNGIYFVKKVDETTIKLARSKENIFTENFISISGTVTNNKFYFYDFSDTNLNLNLVENQKLIRKISAPQDTIETYETVPGSTGIFINGVELLNYKSEDLVYYGEIENINVLSQGNGYDVINPPVLTISDDIGTGSAGYCSVVGSLDRIEIVDPGFDYLDDPVITISGGNGSGSFVKPNLIEFDHFVEFNSTSPAGHINLTNNTVGFSSYHKFRNAEKVIYNSQGGTDVGGLFDGSFYHISVQDGFTVKIHKTLNDAAVGINTVDLTSFGTGIHKFSSVIKKKKLGSISVISSGSNYQNKKVTTTTIGINTSSNLINIKNHGFNDGELVSYQTTGSVIGGLSTTTNYYVTKVSDEQFRLSVVGVGTDNQDFYYRTKQYIDFNSTGSGTHIFNYPEIGLTVKDRIGVSTLSGQSFSAVLQPIFRGSINSVFVESGGDDYGSEEILNFNRQPSFALNSGSEAQILIVVLNGKITDALVVNGGSGYNSPPNLIINGTGSGAQLTPIVSNGSLSEVKVISGGNGYSSSTFVTIAAAGSEAKFDAQIKSWRVNLVERLIASNQISDDDGIIVKSLDENFGLEYAHAYAPRKLRSIVLATKFKDGNPIFVSDLQTLFGVEILSDSHSPIIGWAYDGNPIYGPFGYSEPSGGIVKSLETGYSLSLQTKRPSTSLYPSGFFIEDYEFAKTGDLDEYNGRFCVTPEYPNGVYAYFCTINSVSSDTSGVFNNYRRPLFPYVIGNEYKSKPINFNFEKTSNQDEIDINETGWLRNTTPYNLTKQKSYYDYIIDPNKIKKQLSSVKGVTKGSITSIGIVTGGTNYQVNDQLIFDNNGTGGSGLNAKVTTIGGKQISQVGVANSTVYNVEFVPASNNQYFIGFATQPHSFLKNDFVTVSSSLDYQKSGSIGITTNVLTLTNGIGSTTSTGKVTYFEVSGSLNYPNIKENDIYQIANEQVKVLNVDTLSSRIRVLRNTNNGAGVSTYSAGTTLTEVTRKLQLNFGISTSYQYDLNKEFYFDPTESIGIGTTAGPGIGYTLSFVNPGAGITQINIPTRTIYLPGHKLTTGTPLIYKTNGGTPVSISTNGISSFQLQENSIVYAAKISEDLIGISTFKVGLGSTGSFVGIGSTVTDILYFTNVGVGNSHSFKTSYSNILSAQISRNKVTVSTASSHGLETSDEVYVNVNPGLTTTVTIKYDDYNRRLVVNPRSFVSGDVDIINDTISIPNHKYKTGEKIIHTSTAPSGGLANESIYYAVPVDENKIKLSETYYDAIQPIPTIVGISTSSSGTISQINPQINLIKNNTLLFDVSDSSLSFFNNGVQYSAFDLNFYTDAEFKNIFDSTASSSLFEVIKNGSIGITPTATVTLKTNDNIPSILYYSLNPINSNINDEAKKGIIVDDELLSHSQILLENSIYSGKFDVIKESETEFSYTVLKNPEANFYTNEDGFLEYYTNSSTAYGKINSVSITSRGRNYQKIPTIPSVSSIHGTGSVLIASGSGIGSITNVEIEDIGFDYPSDLSLRPSAKLPEILKIESLSSLKSIGIASVGKNYTIAPNLVLIDGLTNEVISDVDLTYNIGDSQVTILKNTKGISNVTPTIIPTNNINGVGISTIRFIQSSKDVVVTLGSSFSNTSDFPFNIGDKVLIESISVGVGSTAKGYNSENYNYTLFTIVNTDPNIGGVGATVSYNLSEYLGTGEIPGTYDLVNSYGRIIPQKHFPIFNIELQKNQFYIGENVYSETSSGSVLSWEDESSYLKIATELDFFPNQIIFGESSNSQGRVEEVIKFDSVYDVKSSSIVKKGWNTETGFLNNALQRIHDNDYYQYFSYALKSEVALNTWNDVVSDLNHTAGFKKFSDLVLESSSDYTGIATSQDNGDFQAVVDVDTVINTNCIFDFDLAKENNITINGKINSNEITFNSTVIQDYIESIGNRVLMIDDISPQFNSTPRSTTFTIVDTFSVDEFDLNAYRFRKYIALITDKFTTTDQEVLLVSLLHDNANGYLNQYGRVETISDLGSFDFTILGTEASLLFYPNYFSVNNYDVSLASYNLRDITSGIGTVSLGDSAIIRTSTQNVSVGTTTASTIVGIASTYRASKLLIQIEASDKSYFEIDEVTVIHDGTSASLLEYGQITANDLTPVSISGLGTYSAYLSGSNLNIDLTPNSGLTTDYNINAFIVSIGNTSSTTTGSQTITDSTIKSTITSIASSTAPTSNIVSQYPTTSFGAYYIAVVEDKTNNQYQVSELVSVSNSGNTCLTEFAVLETGSSIGSFTIDNPSDVNLYFTPIANANVEVRVYQHAITNIHDSSLTPSIDFINGSIESVYGDYTGTEIDVRKSFYLTHKDKPIFERYILGNDSNIIDISNNRIKIPEHFFVTGQELAYSHSGAGTTQAVGIATTTITGVGSTDKLPATLYVVKSSDLHIQVAASASEALRTPPSVLTLSSVGIGTSHVLRAKNQNSKVIIGLDNVIQSPIVSTAVTTTLVSNVEIISSSMFISGITSFFAGDVIKVGNELMRMTAVGFGSTNSILVDRGWMGSGIATHPSGSVITKVLGNFNIISNYVYFADAPYGEVPFPNPSQRPDEQDYTGLTTSTTFSGRVFLKSGDPDSLQESYHDNYIFDNISGSFNATTKDFTLRSNSQNITGVSTSNAIVLINSIFQQPRRSGPLTVLGDYYLTESSGITSISFTGAASSILYDVNTASIPRGGVIVSVGSTAGFGYQPLVSAGGTAIVSVAGTISSISIGNSGSGYRAGIQTVVNVGVQTSSVGTPNIEFIGTAAISGGRIVSVAITNPGVGYTSSNPPIVVFDDPLSYSNIPLIYSSSSRSGLGTEATVDIIVGQGSSVINFEIRNIGHSYGQGEILTVEVGGSTGIPTDTSLTFKEFQVSIDRTFTDSFSGWTVGDLQVFDPIDSLFDGERKDFPLSIDGVQTTIRAKKGSNIDIKATLLVFINDILQVPGTGYEFNGGSIITFPEPPKSESVSKIIFYKGNTDIDVEFVDILETVKVGDDLTLHSDNENLTETERLVTQIKSSDTALTSLYNSVGISVDTTLLRPVTLCRQTEDKIINGQRVGKDREIYEALIQPTTNIIQNVGVSSAEIFVESVKTFFDNSSEYTSSEQQPKRIIITSQDTIVAAAATAVVSVAGTISSIVISDGGSGYSSAPSVTIESPVGLGSTQRASAVSSLTGTSVASISITAPGTGYTSTNPPVVLIEFPTPKTEKITKVNYSGDFGIITGVSTTSVGVASTGLVLDLFVPTNSFLRNTSINNVGVATTGISGIQTGYYFVVFNSNVGSAVTSIRQNGTVVGYGTQFIDNIYEAAAVSIAQTSVPGIGVTYVTKVTVSLQNYNGITGIGFSNFYGEFSWGRITNLTRANPESFTIYNTGLSGIATSPVVQRTQPLKSRNYTT